MRGRSANTGASGLGILVSVMLLVGCGGSSGAGPAQAHFLSQANASCAVALKSAVRLQKPKSTAELRPFAEGASSIVSTLVAELRRLTPPASLQAEYTKFLATTSHEAHLLSELAEALRAGHTVQAHAALTALESDAANNQAKALGITECARTVSPG